MLQREVGSPIEMIHQSPRRTYEYVDFARPTDKATGVISLWLQ